jgi:hypothetical protein
MWHRSHNHSHFAKHFTKWLQIHQRSHFTRVATTIAVLGTAEALPKGPLILLLSSEPGKHILYSSVSVHEFSAHLSSVLQDNVRFLHLHGHLLTKVIVVQYFSPSTVIFVNCSPEWTSCMTAQFASHHLLTHTCSWDALILFVGIVSCSGRVSALALRLLAAID